MTTLKNILNEYKEKECKLLYNKAVALLRLINDDELEELYSLYPKLFSRLTASKYNPEDIHDMLEAINIFISYIDRREKFIYNKKSKDTSIKSCNYPWILDIRYYWYL